MFVAVVLWVAFVASAAYLIYMFIPRGVYAIGSFIVDTHPNLRNSKCYDCGEKLTVKTKSAWQRYTKHKGDIYAVNLCLNCNERDSRAMQYTNGVDLQSYPSRGEILAIVKNDMVRDGSWGNFNLLKSKEDQVLDYKDFE